MIFVSLLGEFAHADMGFIILKTVETRSDSFCVASATAHDHNRFFFFFFFSYFCVPLVLFQFQITSICTFLFTCLLSACKLTNKSKTITSIS